MKKILAILLSTSIILTACGKEKIQNRYEETTTFPKGDKCEFLIDADWECNDAQCVNVIRFNKDKSFSNWCYCGSPVGDSDIIIGYSYNEAEEIGSAGLKAALRGETGKMMYFKRISDMPYAVTIENIDAKEVANKEKMFPKKWINAAQNDVSQEAQNYFLPLIQGEVKIRIKNGLPVHFKRAETL